MVALLFFVMCAAAGSIFLTAATVSAGRVTDIGKDNNYHQALVDSRKLIIANLQDVSTQDTLNISDPIELSSKPDYKNNTNVNLTLNTDLPNFARALMSMAMKNYEMKREGYINAVRANYESNEFSTSLAVGGDRTSHDGEEPALTAVFVIKNPSIGGSDSVEVTVNAKMYSNYDVLMEVSAGNDVNYMRSSEYIFIPAVNTTANSKTESDALKSFDVTVSWDWANIAFYE